MVLYLFSVEPGLSSDVIRAGKYNDSEAVATLGPFAFCLYYILEQGEICRPDRLTMYSNFMVFRGCTLTRQQLEQYRKKILRPFKLPGILSTTRSIAMAFDAAQRAYEEARLTDLPPTIVPAPPKEVITPNDTSNDALAKQEDAQNAENAEENAEEEEKEDNGQEGQDAEKTEPKEEPPQIIHDPQSHVPVLFFITVENRVGYRGYRLNKEAYSAYQHEHEVVLL